MEEKEQEMNPTEFETFKRLLLIQLERIKKSESLEEAKEINEETIKAITGE